jgi:RNA polymerase sigma-70 factor (ECF subfamily)
MATLAAHAPKALDDRELARLAVAGDGNAFAELYDRHEQRVYGFCMRMLGTPHDAADATQETFVRLLGRLPALEGRDLNFVAYALAAARNACYDMIEGRRKAEPVAEQPEPLGPQEGDLARDPERAALLAAAREDVQAANAALPPRQREVLALREVELLSYDEIGELMGLNRNAVAQLVSRARIKLRDLLRGSALASISASSPDCTRALELLAGMQDDEHGAAGELDWVDTHLAGCDTCRLSRAAMQEADVSYRALAAPIVPLIWLRHAAIARAAEFVGADWSHIAGSSSGAGGRGSGPSEPPPGSSGSVGQAAEERSGRPEQPVVRSGTGAWTARRRLVWTLAAGALLALCVVLVAMVGRTRDGKPPLRLTVTGAAAPPIVNAAIPLHKPHHRTAKTVAAKPSFYNPAHPDTALPVSAAGTPHHSTDRVRSGGHHRRHRAPSTPVITTPIPPPATTPAATAPTTTPVAPPSPPVTSTTPPPPPPPTTTTTPPAQTTPEPAPRGGGLIP